MSASNGDTHPCLPPVPPSLEEASTEDAAQAGVRPNMAILGDQARAQLGLPDWAHGALLEAGTLIPFRWLGEPFSEEGWTTEAPNNG